MKSTKTYIPAYQLLNADWFIKRVVRDAFQTGIFGLPSLNDLVQTCENIKNGINIYTHVPPAISETGIQLISGEEDEHLLLMSIQQFRKTFPYFFWKSQILEEYLQKNKQFTLELEVGYRKIPVSFNVNFILFKEYDDEINRQQLKDLINKEGLYLKIILLRNGEEIYIHYQIINDKSTKNITKSVESIEEIIHQYNIQYIAIPIDCTNITVVKRDIKNNCEIFPEDMCIRAMDMLSRDNRRMRLPVLDSAYLTDAKLGLWDAWWPAEVTPDPRWYVPAELDQECVGSNPWESVRADCSVCIDFGTSSTVAAVRENDGTLHLLRIGGDFAAHDTDTEYENPTAIEFTSYANLLLPWRNEPWRPLIEWKDVKCSHQAKNELRTGPLSLCGIRNIKTWARARGGEPPLLLRDEQNENFMLTPLPVEDSPDGIGDFHTRPLDPIELYAYFIGLALNNQSAFGGRIYCDYAMTFPVKFPREVRQRILQGFYRGLLRSMPPSLVSSPRWQQACPFALTEHASEPTAFAAGVLPYLGIEPTEDGVPFGVFDFGGGTTDFAFGLWRLPTPEEQGNNGWEQVLDILDVAGDENLGGEHLLDILAFELVRAKHLGAGVPAGIPFLCPAGLRPFPGSELLFAESREAHSNTVLLRESLRPLWEAGKLADDDTGQITVSLKKRDGEGKDSNVTFYVDEDALRNCLKGRIREGVLAFFTTFRQAFKIHEIRPRELHILLAGNSCRSPLVREVFDDVIRTEVTPNESETVLVHYEMLPGTEEHDKKEEDEGAPAAVPQNGDTPLTPTLKTGVALGLLRLLPGEATGIVERNRSEESPFLYSVGMFKNERLMPVLRRNAVYGEWQLLSKVFRNGWTLIGYSDSPLAMEEQVARTRCRERRINWGTENFGRTIYIRAVGPDRAELALGAPGDEDGVDATSVHTFILEH